MNEFDRIYANGLWSHGGSAPLSGPGSTMVNCLPVREAIAHLAQQEGGISLCDIGCGDMTYMSEILSDTNLGHLIRYTGVDISREALKLAASRGLSSATYLTGDITAPGFTVTADVVVLKDVVFHLENAQLIEALKALERSTWKYLITNTDRGASDDRVLNQFHWAMADLEGLLFGPYLAKLGAVVSREVRPAHGEFLLLHR